jgi:hypothetical protein
MLQCFYTAALEYKPKDGRENWGKAGVAYEDRISPKVNNSLITMSCSHSNDD